MEHILRCSTALQAHAAFLDAQGMLPCSKMTSLHAYLACVISSRYSKVEVVKCAQPEKVECSPQGGAALDSFDTWQCHCTAKSSFAVHLICAAACETSLLTHCPCQA
jgi:hypothetical protein